MKIDRSNTDVVIDYVHWRVHNQSAYVAHTFNSNLSASTSIILQIKTDSRRVHMSFEVDATLSGTILWREGDTITDGSGTSVISYNLDRSSDKTSTVILKKDPTITVAGTILRTVYAGSSQSTKIGGSIKSGTEYILKSNTNYTILFTADANNTSAVITAVWYEV